MILKKNIISVILAGIINFKLIHTEDSFITIPNFVRLPYSSTQGPFIGLFLALSLPLEIPDYDVFFSYNMEANYALPQNQTEFTYPPLLSDSERSLKTKRFWDRKYFYDILEFKLKSWRNVSSKFLKSFFRHGYPGKYCLLRAICETSLHSSENTGILGDLLHILLTPSSSNDKILEDYTKAERWGKIKKKCDKYEKNCSISFLNLISQIANEIRI